jgi:hypothetical protein
MSNASRRSTLLSLQQASVVPKRITRMLQDKTELDSFALFFLGTLAENSVSFIQPGKLPRGCHGVRAEMMSRAGYLYEAPYKFANGHQVIGYAITQKGRNAWRDCRFAQTASGVSTF